MVYAGRDLELAVPWRRATLYELVAQCAGVEVDVGMPVSELRRIASSFDIPVDEAWGPGKLILEIYEKTTEANLWGPVFVCVPPMPLQETQVDIRILSLVLGDLAGADFDDDGVS